MKKTIVTAMAALCTATFVYGRTEAAPSTAEAAEAASAPTEEQAPSLAERLFRLENPNRLINLTLHAKGSLAAEMPDNRFEKADFTMDDLRLELSGEVGKRVYYRYLQRLVNYPNAEHGTIDKLPLKVDYACIGYRFSDRWRLAFGKMCTAYGGFEFDDNPINVYQYSLIHENMLAFLTGLDLRYYPAPDQEIRMQALNGRNESMEATYGVLPEHIRPSKLDMVWTLNWNGRFGPDKMLATRWSASVLNEAKGHRMYYGVLGTAADFGKVNCFVDLMYSHEELDRKQMFSHLVQDPEQPLAQQYTAYSAVIAHINYRPAPQWNLFVKGIYDTASKYRATDNASRGLYLTAWGYSGGVEYYPIKGDNLHVNLVYSGRTNCYTTRARGLGAQNFSDSRLELSFVYALKLF
jgi:hypothetical protein